MADELDTLLKELDARYREFEQQYDLLLGYRLEGEDAEREKRRVDAISAYKKAIAVGRALPRLKFHHWAPCFERLVVLLRKERRYADEITEIEGALDALVETPEDYPPRLRLIYIYEKRLNRARELLAKCG